MELLRDSLPLDSCIAILANFVSFFKQSRSTKSGQIEFRVFSFYNDFSITQFYETTCFGWRTSAWNQLTLSTFFFHNFESLLQSFDRSHKVIKGTFHFALFFQSSKFLTDKSVQVKRNWRCALFLLKFSFFLPILNFFFSTNILVFVFRSNTSEWNL